MTIISRQENQQVSEEREKRNTPKLDEQSDRGEVSKDGFGDYDKEFHPAEVDIEGDPSGGEQEQPNRAVQASSVDPAARKRFEVHFRMMKIRNRGIGLEEMRTPRQAAPGQRGMAPGP